MIAYFPDALMAVAAISKMGAAKHNNGIMPTKWKDYHTNVYSDALIRHLLCEGAGELHDPESKMLHAGHVAWNALARLEKMVSIYPLKQDDDV